MTDIIVVSPPPATITVSSPGTQGPPGPGSASGTGFVHVTAGVVDAAARAVDLATADVTGVLGVSHLPNLAGDVNGGYATNHVDTLTGVAGVVNTPNNTAWKLTSLVASVGDVIATGVSLLQIGSGTPAIQIGGTTRAFKVQNTIGRLDITALNAEEVWIGTTVATNFKFGVNNTSSSGYLQLDADAGTFPATGLIRTKNYAVTTPIWIAKNYGGDANILSYSGVAGQLSIGDYSNIFGWTVFLNAFNLQINGRTTSQMYVGSGAPGGLSFGDFNTANISILFDLAAAAGNSKIRFGQNIVPFISQDQATTNLNGATFSIAAQAAKTAGAGNGGNLSLSSGAGDGAGAPGILQMFVAATQVVSLGNAAGDYLKIGPNAFSALAGFIRSGQSTNQIFWAMRFSGTDYAALSQASNAVILGGDPSFANNVATVYLNPAAAGFIYMTYGGTTGWQFTGSSGSPALTIQAYDVGGSPVINQRTQTADTAAHDFTLQSQAPFAGATLTNRRSGNILLNIPAPVGVERPGDVLVQRPAHTSGTAGGFQIQYNGTSIIRAGEYGGSGSTYGAIWFATSAVSPSASNWSFLGDGSNTYFNATSTMYFGIGATYELTLVAGTFSLGSNITAAATTSYTFDLSTTATLHFTVGASTSANIVYDKSTSAVNGAAFTIRGQDAKTAGGGNGGDLFLSSGALDGGGTNGAVHFVTGGVQRWSVQDNTLVAWQTTAIPTIKQIDPASGNSGQNFIIQAQAGVGTNMSGGNMSVRGGARTGTGLKGGVHLALNGTSEVMLEAHTVTDGQRFVALCRGANMTTTEFPNGCGDLVVYIGNTATAPTVNPVSGGILYCEGGALKYRGTSGTTTTLGAA